MHRVVYGLSNNRLTPPPPLQPLQQCWQHHMYIPKHNLWIWRWARALNFFGRTWRGLFWVESVLLNRCMVLAAVLQLSFRVLAIFLQPTPSLCIMLLFSDPQRVLCHEVPCWTSSDQYERVRVITSNLTPLLPIHTWDLVTLTSHMTGERKCLIGPNLYFFQIGVHSRFVASGLDINGCVVVILRGTANLQLLYTRYNSLLYIVEKCNFFIVVTWKYIIKYLQKCEGYWDTVCVCVCIYIYIYIYI